NTLINLAATIANFRLVSERAATTVENLDRVVRSNTVPVSMAASNLAQFSGQLNDLAADLQQVLRSNKTDFGAAVKNIESASQMVNSLLSELQAGKGLAGNVLKNEELSA